MSERADRLLASLKRADAAASRGEAGAAEDARKLANLLKQARAEEKKTPEVNMQNLALGAKEAVTGAWDGLGNFIEQGGNALEENYLGLKDGVLRADQAFAEAKGQSHIDNSDALDRVNADLEANRRRQALVPDGVGKVLGGIAGEVVTAAPLLGVGAGAGVLRGAGLGAAEGLGFEFATNAGSFGERAKKGAIGAAGGAAGGALLPAAGKAYQALKLRGDKARIRADETAANTPEGDLRMREAEEAGVPLDRVDAQRTGYAARGDVQNEQLPEYVEYRNSIGELTEKAGRDKVSPLGDIRGAGKTPVLKEDSAIAVQRGFDANREASERMVTDAYEGIRVIDSKSKIPIPGVVNDLKDLADDSVTGIGAPALEILKRNGLIDPTGARGIGSDGLSRLKVGNDITVDQAVKIRKQLTKLFNPNNRAANQELEEIKNLFDDAILNAARNNSKGIAVTPEQIAAREGLQQAADAVSAARKNFVEYRKGTTAEKATKLDADGNATKTPTQRMDDLWNSGSIEKVRTFKEQFKGQPKMLEEIERSANSKIMEAIDAAMDNKASDFNSKMFTNSFLKWTPDFRIEVLGKEGAEALAKFERSVKLQGSTASKTGQHTNSGTAAALARRDLVDGAIKLVGKLGLAKMPLARTLLETAAEGKQKLRVASNRTRVADDARRLLDGNLPAADVKRVQDQLVAELVRENPAWGQGGLANKIVRRWMASSATDDDKDKGERQANSAAR